MNARVIALLAALVALPLSAQERGFAGLGSDVAGFALPDRPRGLTFPADHGPHDDFRIEWWYLTANLRGADLSGADLRRAVMTGCDLARALFHGAQTRQADFTNANLTGVRGLTVDQAA